MSGSITGKGAGNWGRLTVRTDGSILLENVTITDIAIRNCDIVCESGEYPISYADRSNQISDWTHETPHSFPLCVGHTHTCNGLTPAEAPPETPCDLCGLKNRPADGDH